MSGGPACGYLVSRYPSVTHTFVLGEVRALRAAGMRVETASIRRAAREELLSDADREEFERTHALLPTSPRRLAGAHLAAARRAPGAYLRTLVRALRLAHAGGRPRLWQAFYFGEAMLLWAWMRDRGLRHVHVHHANVSADVALLACAYATAAGATPRWTWSVTIHGPTELSDVTTHKLALKVAEAAAVVCISDFTRSQVAAVTPADHLDKLHTVRVGIDVAAFPPVDRAGRDGPLEVLCVAALSRRKGHRVLLEALRLLRERGVDARVTLAGDGPERAALAAQAARDGLGDRVRVLGAVAHDRVPALLAEADAFCLPSFAEGLPTVLMEAMATGLPVVATNVMGTAELVEDGRSGFLVPPARADLIADALARLAADPALRGELGARGRERVTADHEQRAAAALLLEVLAPLSR